VEQALVFARRGGLFMGAYFDSAILTIIMILIVMIYMKMGQK
jgi:hypothetical protein